MHIRRGAQVVAALAVALGAMACNEGLPTRPEESLVLELDTPVTLSGARGSERVYRLTVPAGGGKLRILMSGFTGDADLAVRYGAAAEPTEYDCVSQSGFSLEECIFEAPEAGLWFITVLGYTNFTDARLSARIFPQVGERALTSGVGITGLSGTSGDFEMFRITVPSGSDSLVVALDATGDPDLYVDFELFPLLNSYACASFTETGTERCVIVAPAAGTWIIRVDAYLDFSAGTLVATVYPGAAP